MRSQQCAVCIKLRLAGQDWTDWNNDKHLSKYFGWIIYKSHYTKLQTQSKRCDNSAAIMIQRCDSMVGYIIACSVPEACSSCADVILSLLSE